jgi:hypothetical protein
LVQTVYEFESRAKWRSTRRKAEGAAHMPHTLTKKKKKKKKKCIKTMS